MDVGETVEEGRRSDFSETENENGSTKLHIPYGMKKLQFSWSRNSHNVEVRYLNLLVVANDIHYISLR